MTRPIPFVLLKWSREKKAGGGKLFSSDRVNAIHDMLTRTQLRPFRLICVTDDPRDLHPDIEALPLPDRGSEITQAVGHFFKLYLFSKEFRDLVKEKFIYCDLDVAITGDFADIYDRPANLTILAGRLEHVLAPIEALNGGPLPLSIEFGLLTKVLLKLSLGHAVGYVRDGGKRWCRYNSSFMVIAPDQPDDPWSGLSVQSARQEVRAAGLLGTDQAWLHLHKRGEIITVGKREGFWRESDVDRHYASVGALPEGLRFIEFGYEAKPWSATIKEKSWVQDVYPLGLGDGRLQHDADGR